MNITFDELRQIKHSLPSGAVQRIAMQLNVEEQTVRNYFGGDHHYGSADIVDIHVQPGPQGGIVHLEDTTIYELAKEIIAESQS